MDCAFVIQNSLLYCAATTLQDLLQKSLLNSLGRHHLFRVALADSVSRLVGRAIVYGFKSFFWEASCAFLLVEGVYWFD